MAKFPARLPRSRLEKPRSREPSQPALSYEHIENFTKDLEVRRDLGNRASPVNRAHMKRPLDVTRCLEEMSRRVLVHFFFTAAHFHLALLAASISHFVTAATKFSCRPSNRKMSPLFFISSSRSLSPFFALSFAGLPPAFSFSLSFSSSIFQI